MLIGMLINLMRLSALSSSLLTDRLTLKSVLTESLKNQFTLRRLSINLLKRSLKERLRCLLTGMLKCPWSVMWTKRLK
jgi:hypothetical protein